jgi:hypothetical protein
MRIYALIGPLALVLTALAGCFVGGGDGYHAYATTGKFAVGFAYDGKGQEAFSGAAFVDVDEAANTGVFVAQGKVGATEYRIVFEDFKEAAGKPFQDGGLAAGFREHGASGVGDKSIPEVDLEMAGWGLATLTTGGNKVYKDPISGKDQWTAHFMVIRNGVRNDTNGQIHTKDHMVYSPDQAKNGTGTPGDYELHLVLKNQTANATAAAQIGPFPTAAPSPNPTFSARHTFAVAAPGSAVTVDLGLTGTGISTSNLSFTINDPSGDQSARRALGPGGMAPASQQAAYAAQLRFTAAEAGEYTVMVSGRLAPGTTYSVKGVITPPPTVILNFWWEDLVFGDEAGQKGESSGMLEGTKHHGMHEHAAMSSAASAPRKLR